MQTKLHISATCNISNNTVYKNGEPVFNSLTADLPAFLLAIYQHFQLSYIRFNKMDNLSKLGWLATEVLLKDNFNKDNYKPEEIGLVLSNASSSLDSDLKYMASVADIPSPALFVYTLPNIMIGEICIRNNFKGEAGFFVSESFDAAFIAQYVSDLFQNNILNACICGWVELLGNDYNAGLFLVEKGTGQTAFTANDMEKHFNTILA